MLIIKILIMIIIIKKTQLAGKLLTFVKHIVMKARGM